MPASFQSHFGTAQAEPSEVLHVSQEKGGHVVVQLKGGKYITSDGPLKTVGNALGCYLWAEDDDRTVGFSYDQIVSKTETTTGLHVELPEGIVVNIPDATAAAFDYGAASAKAIRTGAPVPPPPPGVIVKPV